MADPGQGGARARGADLGGAAVSSGAGAGRARVRRCLCWTGSAIRLRDGRPARGSLLLRWSSPSSSGLSGGRNRRRLLLLGAT
ncbi:hypothetical protein ASD08_09345 [Streptomyces sp. Root369]|nr:hypothetical protein ASD08_09345 [Streptomyces sp. Root369]